jgi:hypothetical protein
MERIPASKGNPLSRECQRDKLEHRKNSSN